MSSTDTNGSGPAPSKPRRAPLNTFDVGLTVSQETLRELFEELRRLIKEAVREELSGHTSKPHESNDTDAAPEQPRTLPGGVDLPTTEQLKAKDLRMALLLGKLPEDVGLLINFDTAAKLLSINRRTLDRMVSAQEIPPPIRISGRMRRWRITELLEWIEAGCPHPKHWSYNPESSLRTKGRK
jgi:excisionase family DNA binding protein